LRLPTQLGLVEVAGGHQLGKRPESPSSTRASSEGTTRCAAESLAAGKLFETATTFIPAARADTIPGTESSKTTQVSADTTGGAPRRPAAAALGGTAGGPPSPA